MKAHYLVRPRPTGDLVAVLPDIRDSDTLTVTVLAQLARAPDLEGFDEFLNRPE